MGFFSDTWDAIESAGEHIVDFGKDIWEDISKDGVSMSYSGTFGGPPGGGGGKDEGPSAASYIAAGLGVAADIYTATEMYSAADDARDAGQAAADAEAAFTAEQVRVLTEENKRRDSLAKANAAASGLSGASTQVYMESLRESGRADIDWLNKAGGFAYDAAISSGESAYHTARAAMWGSIGRATGGAASFIDLL